MEISFNIIIPTHRPNFLGDALESIDKQIKKPTRIIIIVDVCANKNQVQDVLNNYDLNYIVIWSHLTGAVNAFKACFRAMEMFSNGKEKNYFHIIEDDVKYLTKGSLKHIWNSIDSCQPDVLLLNMVDIDQNGFLGEIKVALHEPQRIDINTNYGLTLFSGYNIDTCAIVLGITSMEHLKALNTFNKLIKDSEFVLTADSYMVHYFVSQFKNIYLQSNTSVSSFIHKDQISSDFYALLKNSHKQWLGLFKKYLTPVLYKKLKLESRYQIFTGILVALFYYNIKFYGIKGMGIKPKKPSKSFISKFYWYHETKHLINIKTQIQIDNYEHFLRNHLGELQYIIGLNVNMDEVDVSPFIKPYIIK